MGLLTYIYSCMLESLLILPISEGEKEAFRKQGSRLSFASSFVGTLGLGCTALCGEKSPRLGGPIRGEGIPGR